MADAPKILSVFSLTSLRYALNAWPRTPFALHGFRRACVRECLRISLCLNACTVCVCVYVCPVEVQEISPYYCNAFVRALVLTIK